MCENLNILKASCTKQIICEEFQDLELMFRFQIFISLLILCTKVCVIYFKSVVTFVLKNEKRHTIFKIQKTLNLIK